MRKRTSLFVILLSALLMVSMMSAMAFAKDEKEEPKKEKAANHALKGGFSVKDITYPLYVGGVGVPATTTTKTEITNACTSGKAYVQFNSDGTAATLTLTNAVITGTHEYDYSSILSNDIDLTIVLEGANTVGSKDTETDYGIYVSSENDLTIEGDGSLMLYGINNAIYAECGNVKITGGAVNAASEDGSAIYVKEKDFEISNGQVSATSETLNGISVDGNVKITGGAVTATANGGKGIVSWQKDVIISGENTSVTVIDNYDVAYECIGICSYEGNVEINGGTVEVTVSGHHGEGCDAIHAAGNVQINGAKKVTATTDAGYAIKGNNVSITNGSDVTATSAIYAIYAEQIDEEGGDVTIDSSKVRIAGIYVGVIANGNIVIKDSEMEDAQGQIFAYGKLTVQDSKIKATASNDVIFGLEGIDIKHTGGGKFITYVEATAGGLSQSGFTTNDAGYENVAVHAAKGKLNIGDNLSITKPEGGVPGDYGKDDYVFTTVLYNGEPAGHVIIEAPKHDITIEETPGGKVKVEPEKAAEGEEVKVIATPDEGYEVEKIVVIDADGKETDITAKGSFTMGKTNVKVRVTFRKKAAPAAKPVAAVKGIAKGKTSLKFTWKKVKGAAKYEIWMSRCNTSKKKYSVKKVKTLGASKTTWTKKNLRKNTGYKFRVVAKDASGKVICKSVICHSYTGNVWSKYTNVKSLKVSKSSYTLKKGGKAKIKAKQTKVRPDKKLCHHAKMLRYKSNNPSVAKVDKSGKITAVGTGECKIYVQTVNGIWKTVKVSVN